MDAAQGATQKPATAARIYDYILGGVHNFPADREVGQRIVELCPFVPAAARANRAFLGRAVRYLVRSGVRQFLDIGSGIPTQGNVHEIAQAIVPDTRVVYVDIDPVAVAESLELLDGNDWATAIRADVRTPKTILEHGEVRRLLDFDQPVGLLLAAVMHFVNDDAEAYDLVEAAMSALAPGSYMVLSHAATEDFPAPEELQDTDQVYRRQTASGAKLRNRSEIERFFTGLEVLEPGVVRVQDWRPDLDERPDPAEAQMPGGGWAGVGRKA